jgi:RecG-like helicase
MNREWKRSFYYKLLESFPFQPTQGQKLALQGLTIYCGDGKKDAIFLLKGFAGTGKTTLIKSLVQSLPHFNRSSVLMAPTGRVISALLLSINIFITYKPIAWAEWSFVCDQTRHATVYLLSMRPR